MICFQNGCMSDYEVTPELIANLKKGQNLVVQAINSNGAPLTLPLPLAEFAKAYDGPPTDPKEFEADPEEAAGRAAEARGRSAQEARGQRACRRRSGQSGREVIRFATETKKAPDLGAFFVEPGSLVARMRANASRAFERGHGALLRRLVGWR